MSEPIDDINDPRPSTDPQRSRGTRRLEPRDHMPTTADHPGATGALDPALPWVIELRIVGTASVIQVRVSDEMLIGRSDPKLDRLPEIDMQPFNGHDMGVSRRHALIFPHHNRLLIRDLHSANGTYLNGHPLSHDKDYRLRHGDTITVGRLDMQVFFSVMPSSKDLDRTEPVNFEIPHLGAGERLLLIDDDADVGYVIGSVLEQAGFQVRIVGTAREAIAHMDDHGMPRVVLTELRLPDRDGIAFIRYLRQRPDGLNVPLMAVTHATAEYKMEQAIDSGVDVYLCKPVGIDELLRGISKLIEEVDSA